MDTPGYVVLARLAAQRRATDVLAANVANADTPGFKASHAVFTSHLERQRGIQPPPGGADIAFPQDRATWRDFSPGPLQATGNPLDLALSQDGFFAVNTANGERYTRAGRFALSPQGQVVDQEGHPLLLEDGNPLTLAPGQSEPVIRGDGSVMGAEGPLGRLRVVNFDDPQALQAEGARLYAAPAEQPPRPVARPGVVQGSVEGSNVHAVEEVTRLTAELREYQFAAQFAEREGERLGSAVERILKVRS